MKDILKNKKILIILTIILGLGITLGAIYFMYYYKDTRKNELRSGLVSIQFTEGSGVINLQNEVPVIDDVGLEKTPYTFTVKNTSSIPIDVKIKLDINNLTTSIDKSAVRYGLYIDDKLIKKDNIDPNNLVLYTYEDMPVNKTINCKLVLWIDYYYETPNKTFNAKIVVEGVNKDLIKEKTGADKLLAKVNIPATAPTAEQTCDGTEDGLIAINTDGGLALTGDTIREYRYSGGENCVKNYIWFNNENWRIVGIFDGKIKIVKDTPIESAPETYTNKKDDPAFRIQYSRAGATVSEMVWNYGGTRSKKNDWSEAGLMYYLNEKDSKENNSYYDTMNSAYKGFIDENTTYYLGNVVYDNVTPSQAYNQERDTSSSNIWSGNASTWTGKIGLMYPSDYGYATDPVVWNGTSTAIYYYYNVSNIETRNWIVKSSDFSDKYWLISPLSSGSDRALRLTMPGYIYYGYVDSDSISVCPTLYLKSDTKIISGTGASGDPYRLIAEN